ncbi:cytochrome P450 [Trichoderma chlorosporum]
MAVIFVTLIASIGIVVAYALKLFLPTNKTKQNFPPGPKPLPFIGNLADLPPAKTPDWEHWAKHKELYGPISSVTIFGTTLVILNSASAAHDLLEKRGNIYSSRPKMVFGMQMCGWSRILSSLQMTPHLRAHRQKIYQYIRSPSILSHTHPVQEAEAHRFLFRVLRNPADFLQHIRTETGAIILKVTYGYTIDPWEQDPMVDLGDRALDQFSLAVAPGAWLVDLLPVPRYLPEWIPGVSFKKIAKEWYRTLMETAEMPMKYVRMQMDRGDSDKCYVSDAYENCEGNMTEEEYYILKWSAASLYAGGANTLVSTMQTFFLAMTMHPEIQKKAQEEIDRIIGTSRLPCLKDRANLPYIEAIVKEALRWHPTAPMGLPHATSADDTCQGYLIPKGALVMANIWQFTHDPTIYPDPMVAYVYGFGRRICPGMWLADSSVWLTVAKSLAVFIVEKAVQKRETLKNDAEFTLGVVSFPQPYEAKITPRSSEHASLILEVEKEYPWKRSSKEALQSIQMTERDYIA